MARTPRYGRGYLASAWWGELRDAYERHPLAPHACVVCGTPRYQLHHRTYDNLGHEHISDLIALCSAHHERLHRAWRTHREWHPGDTLAQFTDAWVLVKRREHRNALLPDLTLYAHDRAAATPGAHGGGGAHGAGGHGVVRLGGTDAAHAGDMVRTPGGAPGDPQALDGSPG